MEHYGFVVPSSPADDARPDDRRPLHGRPDVEHRQGRRAAWTSPATSSGCTSARVDYVARYHVWKEPLTVRNRTMTKGLAHKTIVDDSSRCSGGDRRLPARVPQARREPGADRAPDRADGVRRGAPDAGRAPVAQGLDRVSRLENRYRIGSGGSTPRAFWDDVRLDRVLPFQPGKDEEDEKHVHPLQLDVIDRCVVLCVSNPGETVLTPFMGVGSEAYTAIQMGRRGIGVELKQSYYRQAVKNLAAIGTEHEDQSWLAGIEDEPVGTMA